MPKKQGSTTLKQAIFKQAESLEPAQCKLVKSQYEIYEWNKERIVMLQERMAELDGRDPLDFEDVKDYVQLRKAYSSERNALVTANNSISSKMFMQLKGTAANMDELDELLNGGADGR